MQETCAPVHTRVSAAIVTYYGFALLIREQKFLWLEVRLISRKVVRVKLRPYLKLLWRMKNFAVERRSARTLR